MSKPFDYSKWDNIELSDDEDDVHPNIERESWFRMKHRSRVEREEKEENEKKKIKKEMNKSNVRIEEIERFLKKISVSSNDGYSDSDDELEDVDGLKVELEDLQKQNAARHKKLDDMEKNKKWNVDNMCHVVEERTIINPKASETKFTPTGFAIADDDDDGDKASSTTDSKTTPEPAAAASPSETKPAAADVKKTAPKSTPSSIQKPSGAAKPTPTTHGPKTFQPPAPKDAILSYSDFVDKHANTLEEWMTIKSLDKCKGFLLLHGTTLLQENATNYLLLASLEDEMNGYHEKMKLTCRQSQILTNIAELAKSLKSHPGNVILPFFARIEKKEFYDGFMDGVNMFIEKIKVRAVEKKKEMDAQRRAEEEEEGEAVDLATIPKEERLGPGGLDPVEVFESLPESMQTAFESRDVENLKRALMSMPPPEAEYHMKRCVDCGLWNEG